MFEILLFYGDVTKYVNVHCVPRVGEQVQLGEEERVHVVEGVQHQLNLSGLLVPVVRLSIVGQKVN